MTAIDDLRHAVTVLKREGSAVAVRVAEGVERYIAEASAGLSLDGALGVATRSGNRPWWRAEQKARRAAAISRVAGEYFSDLSAAAAADEITRAARRERGARNDSDAARQAAAKRPAVRRRLAELAVTTEALKSARSLRRRLPQRWP
jgi:hypothetical protein